MSIEKSGNIWFGKSIWAAALLLSWPHIAAAQQIAIAGYAVPTVDAFSSGVPGGGIVTGPDGALWFTEPDGAKIGRITVAGQITEFPLPPSGANPAGIAVLHGLLWFAEGTNQIGSITTAGVITEYPVPTADSHPTGIAAGPDGALWFTENYGNNIGRITKAGVVTEYPLPAADSFPNYITAGPDGALWFTESGFNNVGKIGRITTAGVITEYATPTTGSDPMEIAKGPDGALWFTEQSGNNIGRITTAGVVTEYPVPTAMCQPFGISKGPDGALWFTEFALNVYQIGRITTAGVVTEYPLPVAGRPSVIAEGPDTALWFAEGSSAEGGSAIGQAVFVTATLTVSPAGGPYQAPLTFDGSGFAAGETVQIYSSGVGSALLASATADGGGSFTATARAPLLPWGPRLFFGVGQSSGKLGAANFTVTPRMTLNPDSGAVGSSATAQGYGFGADESVEFSWTEPQYLLGIVVADINGKVALTFTVPPKSPPGQHTVSLHGEFTGVHASAYFTVP
ncbi:MAG: hypothetical protein ABSF64_38450 [Bryobacteraceae bacterium]|jgi:virginiamycin B lyase